jgi:putative SOS response-associated peptidase YedK
VWFALCDDRPLFAFAGIWTFSTVIAAPSRSRPHQVYGFLTTRG